MKRPEDLGGAVRLADTGLLPAFIQSLPYKSDILALTDDMFASMTAEQRSQLEWSILAKLDQYRTINEQVDAWFRVNDADPTRTWCTAAPRLPALGEAPGIRSRGASDAGRARAGACAKPFGAG